MADRAQVTSIDAIDAFRARLIVYLSKTRPTLEEITGEVHRTRVWLQTDQRRIWEDQLRIRRKKLEQVQAELLSARMSRMQTPGSAQMLAVRKARDAVREAEGKVAALKHWDRELENRTEPLIRQISGLEHALVSDLPKAIAYLTQVLKSLEAYAEASAPRSRPSTPPPSGAGDSSGTPSDPGQTTGEGGQL
jgi:hypothetical protein